MCPECAAECAAIERNHEVRLLAMEDRLLKQMEEEKHVLIDAFLKHLERGDEHRRLGRAKASITRTLRRRVRTPLVTGLALFLLFVTPVAAWALGPTVTAGCVLRWNAVTTSGGVALLPADGTMSYKVYVAQTAATGGPVAPPAGAAVILTAGNAVPICTGLTPGQQYSAWAAGILTPPPPPAGQLAGAPAEGPPTAAVPFVVGTAPAPTKVPDAPTSPSITP